MMQGASSASWKGAKTRPNSCVFVTTTEWWSYLGMIEQAAMGTFTNYHDILIYIYILYHDGHGSQANITPKIDTD